MIVFEHMVRFHIAVISWPSTHQVACGVRGRETTRTPPYRGDMHISLDQAPPFADFRPLQVPLRLGWQFLIMFRVLPHGAS